MRIAQVAPLFERVPPSLYGGTERVVSYLTELLRQGHNVTLFASGDSKTSAELVRCCDVALRLNPVVVDPGTLPGCCARVANGAMAAALPKSVMNSRRLIAFSKGSRQTF